MNYLEDIIDEFETFGGFDIDYNSIIEEPRFFLMNVEYEYFLVKVKRMIERMYEIFNNTKQEIRIKILNEPYPNIYELTIIGIMEE